MNINGLDGHIYRIQSAPDISHIHTSIHQIGHSLIYTGKPLILDFLINNRWVSVSLPFGFEWDGASVPQLFRWLIGQPQASDFQVPSLVHDAGYDDRSKRVMQDVIFYYLLRQNRVPRWKAMLMYAAVRLGGHIYYASDTSRFWRGVKWLLNRAQ